MPYSFCCYVIFGKAADRLWLQGWLSGGVHVCQLLLLYLGYTAPVVHKAWHVALEKGANFLQSLKSQGSSVVRVPRLRCPTDALPSQTQEKGIRCLASPALSRSASKMGQGPRCLRLTGRAHHTLHPYGFLPRSHWFFRNSPWQTLSSRLCLGISRGRGSWCMPKPIPGIMLTASLDNRVPVLELVP